MEKHGSMLWLDSPRTTSHGVGPVDDSQVHVREGSDPVEEGSTVRRRLRKDSGDSDRSRALARCHLELVEPRTSIVTRGPLARAPAGEPGTGTERKCAIELEGALEQSETCPTRSLASCAHEWAGNLASNRPVPWRQFAAECSRELDVRVSRLVDRRTIESLPRSEAPREVDLGSGQVPSDTRDLAARDLKLEGTLELTPGLRCLLGMNAVQNEMFGEIDTIPRDKESRPQVVVLTLEEGRVITKPLALQKLAIE
jgi:hypothetical protein